MPNFKIIQDTPDQARIKIFGSQNVALNTDASGNMSVTPPANGLTVTAAASGLSVTPPSGGFSVTPPAGGLSVTPPSSGFSITAPANGLTVTAPASGLSVTPPSGGFSITAPANGLTVTAPAEGLSVTPPSGGLSVTPPAGGLSVTPPSSGFSITAPASGLTVTAPASGLSVTPPSGGLSITPPANGLLITSTGLSVFFALATTDISYNRTGFNLVEGSPDTTYPVLSIKDWSFGIVNKSNPANLGEVWARLQLSPDGVTWFEDEAVTLSVSTSYAMAPGRLVKYARVYYGAVSTATAVTLGIYFQGQS